jgi:hypothetical protein
MSRNNNVSKDRYLLRPKGLETTSEKGYVEECQRLQDGTAVNSSEEPSLPKLPDNNTDFDDLKSKTSGLSSQSMHHMTYNPRCYIDMNGIYPKSWHAFIPKVLVRPDWHFQYREPADL